MEKLIADELLRYIKEEMGQAKNPKVIPVIGGDWYIKDEILQLLKMSGCSTLVEVFGGGGTISMTAPRNIFKIIVYNDKDELVYSFFKVLREKPRKLMRRLVLMPFSRKLHSELKAIFKNGDFSNMSDVDKATLLFYLHMCGFHGTTSGGFKVVKNARVSRARVYLRKVASLAELAKRWIDVTLENRDFRDIIRLYDSANTVFYCDPPYLTTTQAQRDSYYRLRFTHADMKTLLDMLSKIKGKFVLKLPEDHMNISYIREFASRYEIEVVEHTKCTEKAVEGTKSKQRTVLIYNFSWGDELWG
jgi:DNA adenine methylase